jgi:hypothetical protein
MPSTIVQQAQSNLGYVTTTATKAYGSSQTAGNTNVIMVWASGISSMTSTGTTISDSKGNTYSAAQGFSLDAGAGAALWIFATTAPIAAGSNTVTVHVTVSYYYDIWIAEYPASGGIRTGNGNPNYGGASVTVRGTLSGTSSGDLVVMAGWDEHAGITTAAGAIGANTANQLASDTDNWDVQDGLSDGSSPLTCSFQGTATDWSDWVGIALIPYVTSHSDVVPMVGGGRNPRNSTYLKMRERDRELRAGDRAQSYLRRERDRYRVREAA